MVLEKVSSFVKIPAGDSVLGGQLTLPEQARGLVLFIRSSDQSPHDEVVAKALQHAGYGTLLFHLTSDAELREANLNKDKSLLKQRLVAVTRWAKQQAAELSLGYIATDSSVTVALETSLNVAVGAIVAVGGRFDLGEEELHNVHTPTLLIVGSKDESTLEHNRSVFKQLRCEKQLADVPGATHVLMEPGAIETVALLTQHWLEHHLGGAKV